MILIYLHKTKQAKTHFVHYRVQYFLMEIYYGVGLSYLLNNILKLKKNYVCFNSKNSFGLLYAYTELATQTAQRDSMRAPF